jgi:hypothetical protein
VHPEHDVDEDPEQLHQSDVDGDHSQVEVEHVVFTVMMGSVGVKYTVDRNRVSMT